ncbi:MULTISPECIES: HAD family hydrolase [Kitasatospora]|uniref:Putative hydrolase n=1 Tax=Kitasatospora setae (strain ATCC 33774 / DSM 43861 / JCM 3304 / KCC A-0304 / NBRC 14216 / KM-6054) TaxID=452652 RepID=E4NET9_KITSK|nr:MULTISPECIES: HAD family hydrolase [Kitasatospora]BAJ29875.1 putative hydrolase [Kitasatospora setae KM-6054]
MTHRPPRLVATDLDGTVVRSDRTVSPRTVAAFARVERAGGRFVLVTGRPPRLMGPIAAAFGGRGTAICSNGAFGYDLRTGTVTAERAIPAPALAEAAARLRAAAPGIGLAVEYAHELAADHAYEPGEWDADLTVRRVPDAELFGRPAPKLIGRHPALDADALLALARPALDGLVSAYHSNGDRLVEAVAAGVSKAAALDELAARAGIAAAEAVAFGDMPNDLPMLAWAGTSYAVANAHPAVLAAADRVIGGHDEDGVAEVLERLFPATP